MGSSRFFPCTPASGPTKVGFFEMALPITILLVLTVIFNMTAWDVRISSLFFSPKRGWVGWEHEWRAICCFIYNHGNLPGLVLGVTSGLVVILSIFWGRFERYRRPALFLALLLALGPGLLVNGLFKDYWGRPRPKEVTIFSGNSKFLRVWEKGPAGIGQSFPSGHAATAFYIGSPYFILRSRSRRWAYLFLAAGILYGTVVGIARVAQGGHFPSDILWAWGFVHICGFCLYYALKSIRPNPNIRTTSRQL